MDMSDLAARLEQKFGLGTQPQLRRALYQRLESLVYESDVALGEKAFMVIASVAADALGKQKPGNYFAHVVCERLRERGVLQRPAVPF